MDKKVSDIISLLKEENKSLLSLSEKIKKESVDIQGKLMYYEQVTSEAIMKYRDSTDCLINKIFILENAIIKKDSHIKKLETKNEELLEKAQINNKIYEKELYV